MSIRGTLSAILHEQTHYDFVSRKVRRKWFTFSAALILIGVASLLIRGGLNLGIDFTGGTSWQVEVADGVDVSTQDARQALEKVGIEDAEVAILGGDSVRVQSERATGNEQTKVAEALANYGEVDVEEVSINDVGPTWGDDVSEKAVRALIFFFIAIVIYISLQFEFKMALAAVLAVIHDVFITVGAYALLNFEVNPPTVIAFLTILGFSLYDTVIVFDKVNENVGGMSAMSRETYSDVVNRSMNSVLMRSLNTSIISSLPVFSLLIVGSYLFDAVTFRDFALALTVGLITGAYSSIFISAPFLAWAKEREPRYTAMRARIEKGAVPAGTSPEAVTGTSLGGFTEGAGVGATTEDGVPVVAHRPPPRRTGAAPPRPRQKRRKK